MDRGTKLKEKYQIGTFFIKLKDFRHLAILPKVQYKYFTLCPPKGPLKIPRLSFVEL